MMVGGKPLSREELMLKYEKNVKSTLRRNTRLIDTTVRDANPQLAAKLANELVERYLNEDAEAQFSTTEGANKFLQEEADQQKKKLAASEQALQDYREKYHSDFPAIEPGHSYPPATGLRPAPDRRQSGRGAD